PPASTRSVTVRCSDPVRSVAWGGSLCEQPLGEARGAMPDRAQAVDLLERWVENEGLRRHMYAVEAVLRHYARMRGADEELWGMAGLLHDLDWERHPEEHPLKAVDELRVLGYPE